VTLKCLYCPFITNSLPELLEHEDKEHRTLVEALEGVDGNEEDEELTGDEEATEED
jgi:hypothetical protein